MFSAPQQLPLSLPFKPALGREDFLISPANATAVATLEAVESWPNRCAVLVGPAGSGKSHLAAVWQTQMRADVLSAKEFSADVAAERIAAGAGPLVLEDVDQGVDETAVFHAMNDARERRHALLLTAASPAASWAIALPDLASRLQAAAVAQISAPDDELLQAVLVKQLGDKQITIQPKVLDYLMPRLVRSFDGVRDLVEALDQAMLAQKKPLTVPLARSVLDQQRP